MAREFSEFVEKRTLQPAKSLAGAAAKGGATALGAGVKAGKFLKKQAGKGYNPNKPFLAPQSPAANPSIDRRAQGGFGGTKGAAGANLTGIADSTKEGGDLSAGGLLQPRAFQSKKSDLPGRTTSQGFSELVGEAKGGFSLQEELGSPKRYAEAVRAGLPPTGAGVSFEDVVQARAARTGLPVSSPEHRPTLGGGTLRDHRGREFTASGKKTGDGYIPRGATGADDQPIERGGGTMSVTSTPQDALDYEAQVAADFNQKRQDKTARTRQSEAETLRKHEANRMMEDARKRVDSAQFFGEVPNPIDVETAKAGAGMLGDLGDIARANISAGTEGNTSALAAARLGQKSASDIASQGLKERRFAFDAAKEQQRMAEARESRELAQGRFGADVANIMSQVQRRGEQTRLDQAGIEEQQKQSGTSNVQGALKLMDSMDYMNATPRRREALLVNSGLTVDQARFLMERGGE